MASESLDWQLQCRELKQRGSHLLQSGSWSDCSFLVGTEPHQVAVPGHKLILSMASPVFEAMFYGSLAETSNQPIPIMDVLPDAFKALLEYIYTDEINISCVPNACGLYYGAKKYMLPHLMRKCLRYIWASLCPKNVCYIYEFAKMFEISTLLKTCEQIIERNASEVLKASSFEELESSTALEVFSLRLRVGSELELFEAAVRRARILAPDTNVTIRSMIKKIRFLTLTPQQFADGPLKSPLLTKDESFAIITNIVTSNSYLPLPDGFSACRVSRGGPAEETSIPELNEECWRRVLDYVPVRDIVHSERVSRGWQNVVLAYLTNIRIGILVEYVSAFRYLPDIRWLQLKNATLWRLDSPSFELWCRKLGASVAFTCCASEKCIKTLQELCSNLEAVMFIGLAEYYLQKHTDAFKRLKQLYFYNCQVSDSCIAKFVASNEVKSLLICDNNKFTGECLVNINSTNLESLVLARCEALKYSNLSSAVKCFERLVELELQGVPIEIYENILLLLLSTPNLQVLIMTGYSFASKPLFGAVCKLSRLEFLYTDLRVTDADLEAVARSCENLRVLLLSQCWGVTGRGLRAACALAGARLTELCVFGNNNLTDHDVSACIRACPKLKSLDVGGCDNLTSELLPLAAAARRAAGARRPLTLYTPRTRYALAESQSLDVGGCDNLTSELLPLAAAARRAAGARRPLTLYTPRTRYALAESQEVHEGLIHRPGSLPGAMGLF